MQIANETCPIVELYSDNPKVVMMNGNETGFDFKSREFGRSEVAPLSFLGPHVCGHIAVRLAWPPSCWGFEPAAGPAAE
jgi:hypothetical protein